MSVVDEVRERVDIVDIVSPHVHLQKSGANFKGNCPFHDEKTPSFYVYPSSWSYHCFGCKASGDGFKFLMQKEGLSFAEALRRLGESAGIEVTERAPDRQAAEQKSRLQLMHEAAARFFAQSLVTPAGKQAREYLAGRGIDKPTQEAFDLGYAPDGRDTLLRYLISQGYSVDECVAGGLAVHREETDVTYDRFRNRLIIPIRDREGKTIAFGARALAPDQQPKYLNSPETPLFSKSAVLYGLDRAAKGIRDAGRAVIVEGYLDVISVHKAGFTNAVAPMGTALTEQQVRLLSRLTKTIVLALDGDAAGQRATLRSLEVIRSADLTEGPSEAGEPAPAWDAYARAVARQADLDIRVLTLPSGVDPDDFVKSNPGEWKRLVEEALPFIDHLMNVVVASVDAKDAASMTRAADAFLPTLSQLDPIRLGHYLTRFAEALGVDEDRLEARRRELAQASRIQAFRPVPGSTVRTSAPAAPAATVARERRLEQYALALMYRYPELSPEAAGLTEEVFTGPAERQLFVARAAGSMEAPDPALESDFQRITKLPIPVMEPEAAQLDLAQVATRLHEQHHRTLIRGGGTAAEAPGHLATAVDEGGRLLAVWKSRENKGRLDDTR